MGNVVWIINQYGSTPETGIGGRSYYLAKELAKRGATVYLVVSSFNHLLRTPPDVSQSISVEQRDGFKVVWVKVPEYRSAHSKLRVLNWFLFSWKLRALSRLIPDKPDAVLVSSPSPFAFWGARKLAKKYAARLVFEVRDIWPLTLVEIGGFSPKHPFIRLMQWVEDYAYLESDKVVSNLRNAADHMVSRGMLEEKFHWISNGVSIQEASNEEILPDSVSVKIPKGKWLVGYTGTLGLANSIDTLIEAAGLLSHIDDIHFVLIGPGKEKVYLEKMVEEKQLCNVSFIDSVEKKYVHSVLQRMDCLYIAAKMNPLYRFGVSPNKLFDYLYSGKPIVYAIDSGSYKPVEELGCGLQVKPECPRGLADGILELYKMPSELHARMGELGRNGAIEQYEYGALAAKLEQVLFEGD